VSERGLARHDVRVKVSTVHGPRVQYANMATVAVRPALRLVAGDDMPAIAITCRRGPDPRAMLPTGRRRWRAGITIGAHDQQTLNRTF
jgi:hypothetical protein